MKLLSELFDLLVRRNLIKRPELPTSGRDLSELFKDLLSSHGEISGLATAAEVLQAYKALDDDGKRAVFNILADDFDLDPDKVEAALSRYRTERDTVGWANLMRAAEPPRQELIRRLNRLPGATETLVGMRADMIRLLQRKEPAARIDLDFQHLFSSWFNRGFLLLRRISWESPAHILEKIIRYEAVHSINSWEELRRRVEPVDRRCFAFFHPAMPDEPLIFVEVALTKGIPVAIGDLLAAEREVLSPDRVDCAVFYSISNCQAGLAGISFGNFLIKQVAADLAAELPELKTFVTLSPIPLLNTWLKDQGEQPSSMDPVALRRAAARYLLTARRDDGFPFDPVERFHLGNGAELHAIHIDADMSPRGISYSSGVMVNYLYDLAATARNHESYANRQEIVASPEVIALVAEMPPFRGVSNAKSTL